jgi:AcrR family transcriptional regulator
MRSGPTTGSPRVPPPDPVAGMTPTEMESVARELLLESVLRELAESGRKSLSLETVLGRSGVSAAEFAASYADLDACLDAAYDELTARIATAVRVGCRSGGGGPFPGPGDWPGAVRGGVEALLAELAADPPLTRTLVRAFPSLGNQAQARYQSFVEGFAPLLSVGREASGAAGELPDSVEMLAVGAAEAIVFEEVASGRTADLPRLLPSILFSVLVPFLGPVAAAAEMEKARH